MRQDHSNDSDRFDPLAIWAEELRDGLIKGLTPGRMTEIATVAGTVVVSSTALASAASAAVSQGGITMSIGQAIGSSGGLKLAAGGLAAALALGGGAMATGNLACEIPGSAADVEGNLLVQTGLDGRAKAQVEQRTIEVEGLGFVDVAHDDVDVEVRGLRLENGSTAEVRSEGEGGVEIDFALDGVTRTLLVSVVDGQLFASMAPFAANASIAGDAAAEADANANSEGALDIDVDVDAEGVLDGVGDIGISGDVDADGDIDISGDVDADGGGSLLGGLGLGGDTGLLGFFGVDAEIDN